ncbi:DNA helicase RecG, partial [Peptococcaceae bacterium]|nr:DNA helicase RecG [Peptococcaceae bacterium]
DVPNATVMAIIDAERFGLAQLHQLRGRVGRGTNQSYCILVCDPKSKESRMRINAFVNTSDGFELAEQDLRLRGPGEFLGTKQSGIPKFKIADIIRDQKALIVAKKEAELMLENKGTLSNEILLQELKKRFKTGLSLVN